MGFQRCDERNIATDYRGTAGFLVSIITTLKLETHFLSTLGVCLADRGIGGRVYLGASHAILNFCEPKPKAHGLDLEAITGT